jgi:hypothetical protein
VNPGLLDASSLWRLQRESLEAKVPSKSQFMREISETKPSEAFAKEKFKHFKNFKVTVSGRGKNWLQEPQGHEASVGTALPCGFLPAQPVLLGLFSSPEPQTSALTPLSSVRGSGGSLRWQVASTYPTIIYQVSTP